MTRTKGAKSKKKLKFYGGKPVKKKSFKNGKFVPYVSKRNRDDPVRVWFQEKKKMSRDGYLRFNRRIRSSIQPVVKVFVGKPVLVDPMNLSTPERVCETAVEVLQYPGIFNLLMPTASKSSYRVSYKKKAVIRITEAPEGLHGTISEYGNLKRYWFFHE